MNTTPINEMPCDCCGMETNDIVWEGLDDTIGMFICPLCKMLQPMERYNVMMTLECERLGVPFYVLP